MNFAVVKAVFLKSFRLLAPYVGAYLSSRFSSRLGRGDSSSSTPALPVPPQWPQLMLRCDGDYGLTRIDNQSLFFVTEDYLTIGDPVLLKDIIDQEKLAALLARKR